MKNKFKTICRMSQESLKEYLFEQLLETHNGAVNKDGFLYAQGKFPVLLVAHLDTVHDNLPGKIKFKNGKFSSPNGIGGDDRCGVFMILEIVKQINCSVLFCEDEEVGGVGAEKFISTQLASELVGKFNYIIEFDRKGSDDAVFYNCDNPQFEDFITKHFYKTNYGSFSDISIVAPFLQCAAVNLSCGYYKAHTKQEYVVWDEMINSIYEALKIIGCTTEDDVFEYIECENNYWFYGYDYNYEYKHNTGYYAFEFIDNKGNYDSYELLANTEYEAIGLFCMDNPDIPYENIVDYYLIEDLM